MSESRGDLPFDLTAFTDEGGREPLTLADFDAALLDLERSEVRHEVVGLDGWPIVVSPRQYKQLQLIEQGLCPDCASRPDRWGWCPCSRVRAVKDESGNVVVRPLP